ncbi:hypothetical protein D9619_001662 [Psilocybe cf. subviscida]|uniref:Uncharacterized protein n=1 Tax=Psilocybe cf. subviscida TaxID=2480587 RepID=A0A8H5BG94_9AGAR|nr:hypothetical protein D9619_001662 [Psilocybe cf. subviscida]
MQFPFTVSTLMTVVMIFCAFVMPAFASPFENVQHSSSPAALISEELPTPTLEILEYKYASVSSTFLSTSSTLSQQPTTKSASSDAQWNRKPDSRDISIITVIFCCTTIAYIF